MKALDSIADAVLKEMAAPDPLAARSEAAMRSVMDPQPAELSPEQEAEVQERARRIAVSRFKDYIAAVPPIVRTAHLTKNCMTYADDPGKARALKAALWLNEHGSIEHRERTRYGLFLTGQYGTGKTWLATALWKALSYSYLVSYYAERLRAGGEIGLPIRPRWVKFYAFVREVQDCYHRTAEEAVGVVIERYQKTPVLLLDDVGDLDVATESEDRKRLLYEVLDYRNDWGLPTVLTTNLNMSELQDQFGGRTVQRVLEMAALVEMGGSNLRIVSLDASAGDGR